FFSSRRRHTSFSRDWSSDVCSSDLAAFIRLAEPVRFDVNDGRTARLLFFLLIPETATQAHLDLLAGIARLMSDAGIRQTLTQSTDPREIHHLILTGASAPAPEHADHPRADS